MGKLTIHLVGGESTTLPTTTKEIFDKFTEFFIDERKTNLVLQTNNGCVLYPKDKILYILYETNEEK